MAQKSSNTQRFSAHISPSEVLLPDKQFDAYYVVEIARYGGREYVAVLRHRRFVLLFGRLVLRVDLRYLAGDVRQSPHDDVVFVVYGTALDRISVVGVCQAQAAVLDEQHGQSVAVVVAYECRGGFGDPAAEAERVVGFDGGRGECVDRGVFGDQIHYACGFVDELSFDVETDASVAGGQSYDRQYESDCVFHRFLWTLHAKVRKNNGSGTIQMSLRH